MVHRRTQINGMIRREFPSFDSPMLQIFIAWFKRYFSHPEAALLVVMLAAGFVAIYLLGDMLAPLFTAVVLAYVLEAPVRRLATRMPRLAAVSVIFMLFIVFAAFALVILLPILLHQATQLVQEVPGMINRGQDALLHLPEKYPDLISAETVRQIFKTFRTGVTDLSHNLLSISLASIPALIALLVYLVLVPLLIFFFLKDKDTILAWMSRFLPANRRVFGHLWNELDAQFGNYIRGKVYEIFIVGSAAYVIFKFLSLDYASLLAIAVGLSVLVPFVGAVIVTLPVALVGYFQWGLNWDFAWLLGAYFTLHFIDGNLLVPILFSDIVNIHPVAIIAAILVFGGLWGFWGVFFAIPLATLVKALINIWPRSEEVQPIKP